LAGLTGEAFEKWDGIAGTLGGKQGFSTHAQGFGVEGLVAEDPFQMGEGLKRAVVEQGDVGEEVGRRIGEIFENFAGGVEMTALEQGPGETEAKREVGTEFGTFAEDAKNFVGSFELDVEFETSLLITKVGGTQTGGGFDADEGGFGTVLGEGEVGIEPPERAAGGFGVDQGAKQEFGFAVTGLGEQTANKAFAGTGVVGLEKQCLTVGRFGEHGVGAAFADGGKGFVDAGVLQSAAESVLEKRDGAGGLIGGKGGDGVVEEGVVVVGSGGEGGFVGFHGGGPGFGGGKLIAQPTPEQGVALGGGNGFCGKQSSGEIGFGEEEDAVEALLLWAGDVRRAGRAKDREKAQDAKQTPHRQECLCHLL
jgi:hypothetical protein